MNLLCRGCRLDRSDWHRRFFLVATHIVVVDEAPSLDALGSEIRYVAGEQEEIPGLNLPREPHEHK